MFDIGELRNEKISNLRSSLESFPQYGGTTISLRGILPLSEEMKQTQGTDDSNQSRTTPNSLIDEFIDVCADHGVPEELIAQHVVFMAKSMQEIIQLEAERHRKQQEERALMFDRKREKEERAEIELSLRRQLFEAHNQFSDNTSPLMNVERSEIGIQAAPEPHARPTTASKHREALGKIQRERHKSKLQQHIAPGYRKRFLRAQEDLLRQSGINPDHVPLEDLTLEGRGWSSTLRTSPSGSPSPKRGGSPVKPTAHIASFLSAREGQRSAPKPDLSKARSNRSATLRAKQSHAKRIEGRSSAGRGARPSSGGSIGRPTVKKIDPPSASKDGMVLVGSSSMLDAAHGSRNDSSTTAVENNVRSEDTCRGEIPHSFSQQMTLPERTLPNLDQSPPQEPCTFEPEAATPEEGARLREWLLGPQTDICSENPTMKTSLSQEEKSSLDQAVDMASPTPRTVSVTDSPAPPVPLGDYERYIQTVEASLQKTKDYLNGTGNSSILLDSTANVSPQNRPGTSLFEAHSGDRTLSISPLSDTSFIARSIEM